MQFSKFIESVLNQFSNKNQFYQNQIKMMIKIKYFGKEFELEINPDSKVEDIKQIIEEKECIPIRQQRLIFSGKPMLNEKSANDYKLKNGSVIYLTKTLSGLAKNSAELLKRMEQFRSYQVIEPKIGERKKERVKVIEVDLSDLQNTTDLESFLENLLINAQ